MKSTAPRLRDARAIQKPNTLNSRRAPPPTQQRSVLARSTDYVANATDQGVLQLPLKQELEEEQLSNVFGYERDLQGRYIIGKVIGAGSFGVVREAIQKGSGTRFAVKSVPKIPKRGVPTPRYLLKLRQEVDAMMQLGASLDAVYLADVFEDDADVHIVMELCEGGALTDRVNSGDVTDERDISRIVASILRFIAQCHAKGLVYRDCKLDNFLFVGHEPRSPLKATDFGLSIRHTSGEQPLTSRSGTPAYMAPEVIMQSYSSKADLWSVGIVTYQLLTGRFPFCDNIRNSSLQDVWKAILSESGRMDKHVNKLRGKVSDDACDFVSALMQRDPSKRFSATQALQHPWLQRDAHRSEKHPLDGSVVQRLQRFATYGSLKQQVLRIITDELAISNEQGQDALKKVYQLFLEIDLNGDGIIDTKELRKGLKAFGYNLTDAEVHQLMLRMDLNQDGTVDFSELAASLIDWQKFQAVQEDWDAWLDRVFERLDTDASGYVDLHEIMSYVPVFEPGSQHKVTEEDLRDRHTKSSTMMREMDSDGDGMISRDEFRAILTDSPEMDSLSNYDMRLMPAVDEEVAEIPVAVPDLPV